MAVRTFFWEAPRPSRTDRIVARLRPGARPTALRVGNAGDIFVRDVIRMVYGEDATNVADDGRRLLLIGSIAHRVLDGDVVCGAGTKGAPLPPATQVRCKVVAVRGPITLEAFEQAGHDVSEVRSLRDPGLLLRFAVPDASPVPGRRVLIPHYRERHLYRGAAAHGLDIVDIDGEPVDVARGIQAAEVIYTSSLHGMIFAHALRRPCVLLAPQTAEPEIKYRDYFASVGMAWRTPGTLEEALREPAPGSAPDLEFSVEDFGLPPLAELREAGIAG